MRSNSSNTRRHTAGDAKGSKPSKISTSARASHMLVPSKACYFLGATVVAAAPRMVLKNSEPVSSTIRSLFLLKLAL